MLNARFIVTPRFEICYALATLADPASRIHQAWKNRTLARLPAGLRRGIEGCGSAFWAVLADAVGGRAEADSFEALVAAIAELPIERFQRRLLLGQLHQGSIVDALLSGRLALSQAVTQLPKHKREWLSFIDLYPHDGATPAARTLQALLDDPEPLRRRVLDYLSGFWPLSFAATWRGLEPELERSRAHKEHLYRQLSLAEFARAVLLRIEVDDRRRQLKAIRGGYTLPLRRIAEAVFMPSVFNDRRYWSAFHEPDGRVFVCFPCFDPSILLDLDRADDRVRFAEPEIDPAMVFRALGDSTRFALVGLLAERPRTSVELARALGLSKPTVSHHVFLLREAGLLDEQIRGGATTLSVRRATLERLSAITLERLFEAGRPAALTRSRRSRREGFRARA